MKLEEAVCELLNDPKNGLLLLLSKMVEKCKNIKKATENNGDLKSFKLMFAEVHEIARRLEIVSTNADAKVANFAENEIGEIIDLSIPPEQRT